MKSNPDMQWRVHTSRMAEELAGNPQCAIFRKPLIMLCRKLAEVAQRSAELNDPVLNGLMVELTLYAIADPDEPDYDEKRAQSVMRAGRAAARKLASKSPREDLSL